MKKYSNLLSKIGFPFSHTSSNSNITKIIPKIWRKVKVSGPVNIALIILLACIFSPTFRLAQTQTSKKVEVILLENGVFDSTAVITAINGYADSVEASLGYDCSIVKLPSQSNNPQGIDDFIESRYSYGAQIFILVGNDLKWPLSIGSMDSTPVARPADGVLCDTDGELSIVGDGLHQPISPFTAEASVSYIFPPKSGITIQTQINFVVNAFQKFSKYHQGILTYEKKAVVCGHFSPPPDALGFQRAIDNMTSACEQIFGKENVTKKELTNPEVKAYLEQALAFFGVAGHGNPEVVETSSIGDYLFWSDITLAGKAPMLMEIFGCWTEGWIIIDENDPWAANRGFLSEAGILESTFNIAMVSGTGPESTAEYSFANLVLSQVPINPEATIGELMIGNERRSSDWTLFGDPTLRLHGFGGGAINRAPIAYIDYITPETAEKGTIINFKGHGYDSDGTVTGYSWRSDIDGFLSNLDTFSTPNLSVGTHNIYFKVQDNNGKWSQEVTKKITITPPYEVTILSPTDGETVTGKITIRVSTILTNVIAANFYIDGIYKGYDKTVPYEYYWDTTLYSNGPHKIYATVYTSVPIRTATSKTITVNVNNPLPTVTIITPADGAIITAPCTIEVSAASSDKVNQVRFYIDGIIVGYDYWPPFQWSWDALSYNNGSHTIRAEAYYTNLYRYISSQQITVIVINPKLQRTVTITNPQNGTKVAGTITINVEATGEYLLRVYLYVDGNYMGYDATKPYQFSLNTAYLSNGPHKIYAVGLYNERPPHALIASQTIILIVSNPA